MLERLTPFLSDRGYFVLDDVYTWSGAQSAYSDYFQVNLDWLHTIMPEKHCWTSVTLKNHAPEIKPLAVSTKVASLWRTQYDSDVLGSE